MTRVRGVTAVSTAAGSMFSVSGSTSTSTGRAPTCSITFTDAVKVSGVVITSSPGPTPSVARAVCSPAVHEFSASAPGASRYAANSVSKRWVFGPVVIQSERSVSTTSWISSSPMTGGAKGRNSVRRSGARVSDTGAPSDQAVAELGSSSAPEGPAYAGRSGARGSGALRTGTGRAAEAGTTGCSTVGEGTYSGTSAQMASISCSREPPAAPAARTPESS